MLNIQDTENYDAIDAIRQGEYGISYAKNQNLDPTQLPQKLVADKKLVAALDAAKESNPDAVQAIYDRARKIYGDLKKEGIDESALTQTPGVGNLLVQIAVVAFLFPLAVFSLWPASRRGSFLSTSLTRLRTRCFMAHSSSR